MIARRHFVFGSCAALAGATLTNGPAHALSSAMPPPPTPQQAGGLHLIRPLEGYSPQIGQLVSMANWIRASVLREVQGLSQQELDHLFDSEANTIGALLLHLAATEVFYQANTFEGRPLNEAEEREWGAASELGAAFCSTNSSALPITG